MTVALLNTEGFQNLKSMFVYCMYTSNNDVNKVIMEFSIHTTLNSTQQQHVQKHYSCISRPQKFYLKIRSQKLDLYTSIYGILSQLENC